MEEQDLARGAQVLMGTLEIQGSSVGGRMATGAAVSAKDLRLEQQRQDTSKLIFILNVLRDTLRQIDERIAQLNKDTAALEERLKEAKEHSEAAFARMHELEEILEDGLSEAKKERLNRIIGPESKDVSDEAMLLEMARVRIDEEHRTGLEAHARAENIRDEIEEKIKARDDLIDAREQIIHDTDASPEEKLARAELALRQSFETDIYSAEAARQNLREQANLVANEVLDEQRTELTEADDFKLDEDMTLDESLPPSLPGPR